MKHLLATILIVGISFGADAQNKVLDKFGKGFNLMAKDSSFSMKFGIRFQTI